MLLLMIRSKINLEHRTAGGIKPLTSVTLRLLARCPKHWAMLPQTFLCLQITDLGQTNYMPIMSTINMLSRRARICCTQHHLWLIFSPWLWAPFCCFLHFVRILELIFTSFKFTVTKCLKSFQHPSHFFFSKLEKWKIRHCDKNNQKKMTLNSHMEFMMAEPAGYLLLVQT